MWISLTPFFIASATTAVLNFITSDSFSIASISSSGAFSKTSPASPKSDSKVLVFSLFSSLIVAVVTSPLSDWSFSINSEIWDILAACNSIFFYVIAFKFLIKPSFELSEIAIWRVLPSTLKGATKFTFM